MNDISRLALCLLTALLSLPVTAATKAVFDNDDLLALGDAGGVAGLRAADVTGDGKPDVVALAWHHTAPQVHVYPSQGDGTFAAARVTTLTTVSQYPTDIAFDMADVNADGKLDIALAFTLSGSGPRVQIYHGVGDGTFTAGALLAPSGGCWETTVKLADLTNDGRPEVLTCDLSVFLNQGSGNFGSAIVTSANSSATAISVGHANGDAFPDVFLQQSSSYTLLLLGNGNGTFGTKVLIDAQGRNSAVADFDGNGRSDVVFHDSWRNDLALRKATSAGTYPDRLSIDYMTYRTHTPIFTADMNADGRPDVLTATSGIISIWLTNAGGTPAPAARYVTAGGSGPLAVADFDADGAMDVVTAGGLGTRPVLAVTRGAAGGALRTARAHVFYRDDLVENNLDGGRPVGAALSDVTGDGKVDAISLSSERQTIIVLPGNGDGTTGTPIETFVQHEPNTTLYNTYPLFADFDGNGVLDVALTATSSYWVDVWLANGNGTLRRAATTDMFGITSAARAGDFDGDGHQDIVYIWEGTLRFYPGNGDGTFDALVTPAAALETQSFVTGDVNGDERDDVVADGVVLLGAASRTFTRLTESESHLDSSALADLNADGHLDFVETSDWWFDDPIPFRVRLGAGDGTFGLPRQLFANVNGPGLPGDFNADGNVDLLFGTTVLLGDGAGSFAGQARWRRGSTFLLGVATGDLDGNGSSDILYANNEEHAMELVRTWIADSRETPLSIAIGTTPASVEVGDRIQVPVTASGLGTVIPSGAVVVGVGGEPISFVELEDGAATGVVLHQTIGAATLTARFGGDDFYGTAAASPVSQEATRATPELWWFTSPYYPRVREDIHITGTFSSGTAVKPTGTVTVFVDGVMRGTGSAPTFDINVGPLPAGNPTVTIQYAGDALHLPFYNNYVITIQKLVPKITFTVSPSGSANVNTPVTLTATFEDPTTTGEVRWVVGIDGHYKETATTLISGGTASWTTSTLPVGPVVLGAYFPGSAEYVGGSEWDELTIVDQPIPPSASSLWLIAPCRILDTRGATGPWGGPSILASAIRSIQITGKCGIPAGAKAVAVNVTAVTPASTGYLALFPGASTHPGTSTLSYRAGRTRASNAVMALSAGGILKVYNSGADATHVLLDITGYFK